MKTDNQIIAEFMGLKVSPVGRTQYDENGRAYKHEEDLDYDCSWNDLMPVVEKIYRLEENEERLGIVFTLKNSRAVIKHGKKVFTCHTISPLNSAYRVVVEFIKWYNSTLK